MGEQISDFKAWLYLIQLWLERHPKIQKLVIYIYTIMTIGLTLLGFFVLENTFKPILFLLVIILLFLLIVIDYYHVEIIKNNRFELEERKRLISELVSVQHNNYRVKYRREIYEIEPDGDAIYTRDMILEYDNSEVAWAEMLFGSTNDYGNDFNRMILHAKTFPHTNYPLSRVPVEATKSRMRFAIILRNKLSNTNRTEGFQLTMKWVGAWKELLLNNKDNGILRIDYETSECILELRLPPGYSFINFYMPRTKAEPIYEKSDDGRNIMRYELTDLPIGESYTYFVEIKKD